MGFIEITDSRAGLTNRQRWGHVFVVILSALCLIYGLSLRQNTLTAKEVYENTRAGIIARYPSGWLLDTSGDYVFRVRDMTTQGYKTSIQVATIPISADTTERNLEDSLTLIRAQTLTDYRVLSVTQKTIRGQTANVYLYTYVSTSASPFLEEIPAVVVGTDYIVFSGGQAIVITFRADRNMFDGELDIFNRFLSGLEF